MSAPDSESKNKLTAHGGRAPRLVGRHYRVTWRWDDPKHKRHGELVTSNYYGPIGSAKEFWTQHSPASPVVNVRMTYSPKRKSSQPNALAQTPPDSGTKDHE